MKPQYLKTFLSTAALLSLPVFASAQTPKSATVLEFADPTTLFVADSAGAAIFA